MAHLHEQGRGVVIAGHRLSEHHELLVVGRKPVARLFSFCCFGLVLCQRRFDLFDLLAELRSFFALGAKERLPEDESEDDDRRSRDDRHVLLTLEGAHLSRLPSSRGTPRRTSLPPFRLELQGPPLLLK